MPFEIGQYYTTPCSTLMYKVIKIEYDCIVVEEYSPYFRESLKRYEYFQEACIEDRAMTKAEVLIYWPEK